MRKWKRVETATGPRFRSALAEHEAALLGSLVTSMLGMLDERGSSAPADELENITGMKAGNPRPPEDDTMRRLLPDFFRAEVDDPAGPGEVDDPAGAGEFDDTAPPGRVDDPAPPGEAESLNSALRSLHEPKIIDAKRDAAQRLLQTLPDGGGKFEITESDAHAWAAAVNDVRLALGTMLEVGPGGPERLPTGHPMAGHLDVYQWLTVLQEYLVLGLTGRSSG